ncbi:hypothetical protein [Thioclava atlantica]|uniref:Uncharacterized protein n=1 Tax=Thioclava atlantica TaxID=1317124 RepID=A0A085TSH9_9RHOB|nr:hypothetical protein [Thioclava atlantica]KFE33676.1 hypothetical protein DW2_16796 [Thioclava atlantica]
MKLPSLHLPVIVLAGFLGGLGLYYLFALLGVLWRLVLMGVVLLVVLEALVRISQAVIYRMGARPEDEAPAMPRLRGRDRYAALGGVIAGMAAGFALWGPVLIWKHGGGA